MSELSEWAVTVGDVTVTPTVLAGEPYVTLTDGAGEPKFLSTLEARTLHHALQGAAIMADYAAGKRPEPGPASGG
jgi:hypothetical protein